MAQVVLTWTPGGNATSQQVQYSLSGANSWTTFSTVAANATTETVTGLSDNTHYDFRIVNVCAVGGPQPSSSVARIKLTCPVVTLTKTYYSVIASFPNLGADISSYVIFLYDNSDTQLTSFTVNSPFASTVSREFAGLDPSTTYKVKVVTHAGADVKSDCNVYSITTDATPVCGAPTIGSAVIS